MFSTSSVLKDSRKHNSQQLVDTQYSKSRTRPLNPCLSDNNPRFVHNLLPMTDHNTQGVRPLFPGSQFVSPIRTLTESIQDPGQDYIFVHDLAEAYNLLSTRIRAQAQVILASDKCEQLAIFARHSSQILECVARDIRRALPNPFASQYYASLNDSCDVDDVLDDEEFQIASDNSTVCHYALLFVSDIFIFPALYSIFTDDQLRTLLHDVLCICTTPDRPFPNSQKLYGMVVWLLKVQHLPPNILSAEMPAIISVLRDAITLESGGAMARLDALRAIHCMLKQHPSSTDAFTPLLLPVLDHLNSPSIEVRIHAAYGLSGFAQAKLCPTRSCDYPTNDISEIVQEYMEVQTSRKKSLEQSTLLPAISLSALDGEVLWDGKGPSFAVVVVSCLIVLLDQSLFNIPRCLKFIFPFLGRCKVHKKSTVRNVQPRIWQLTVWAFSHMTRPKVIKKNKHDLDVRQRVALIVSQDPSPEVLVYVVACLLEGEANTWDFEQALGITEKLAASDGSEDNASGLQLLSRFLSNIGLSKSSPSRTNTHTSPVAHELLDGSLLSRGTSNIRLIDGPSCMNDVTPFPEQQILNLWPTFSKIWSIYVQRFLLGPDTQLAAKLFDIWQSLLLVQAQLTQGNQHLTSSPLFSKKVISVMTKLSTSLSSATDQSKYLSLISKLWSTTKNVFAVSWLESPAEQLLASLLTRHFDLADEDVKEQWSELCADLISVGVPTVLHVLRVRSESQEGIEVTRQLWLVLAKHGPLAAGHEDWIGLLHFLVMPFGAWTLSSTEIDLWEDLFARAVHMALRASRTPHDAVSQLMELLGDKKITLFKEVPSLLKCLLIHYVSAESCTTEPKFFKMLDEALTTSYRHPSWEMSHTLEILRLMGKVLGKTPEGHIVEAVSAIQTCLTCWIADDANVLEDDEHGIIVTNLYCEPLKIVSQLSPSMKILDVIAPFLQSVFVRIRGRGPMAFQKFWRACYHKRLEFEHEKCPELIQTCLKGWGDFCDDSVADNLSIRSGTQSLMPSFPSSRPLPLSGRSPERSGWNKVAESGSPVAGPAPEKDGEVGSQQSGSNVTITPIQGKTAMETSRLLYAQAFSDLHGASEVHLPHELSARLSNVAPISGTKRRASAEAYSTPKRRRTEPDIHPKPRLVKDREIGQPSMPSVMSFKGKASLSEPVTRASSSALLPAFSLNHPAQRLGSPDEREEAEHSRRIPRYSGARYRSRPSSPALVPLSDEYDYDDWEKAVSEQDLRRVQVEMLGKHDGLVVPDSEEMVADLIDTDVDHQPAPVDDDVFGPSTSDFPLRSRRRERSQTAPEISAETFSPVEYPPPLRRNLTSPLHRKTSSLQLEALQTAYAIITDTGTSQVEVQDIMHARRLANQINQVLDEQMCSKFGAKRDGPA